MNERMCGTMFCQDLFADLYTASVYDLDWEMLSREYDGVIFDIDNTLVPHGAPADERAMGLFRRLRGLGMKTMLVSNNGEARVKPFAGQLGTDYVHKAGKPKRKGYEKAAERMGLPAGRILFVGDQIFTDIWGANRAGMRTVLTEPVDPSTDEIQIVIKRWFEKPFRRTRKSGSSKT